MTVAAGPSWRVETWSGNWGAYSIEIVRLDVMLFSWVVYRKEREVKSGQAGTPAGAKSIAENWIYRDRKSRNRRKRGR